LTIHQRLRSSEKGTSRSWCPLASWRLKYCSTPPGTQSNVGPRPDKKNVFTSAKSGGGMWRLSLEMLPCRFFHVSHEKLLICVFNEDGCYWLRGAIPNCAFSYCCSMARAFFCASPKLSSAVFRVFPTQPNLGSRIAYRSLLLCSQRFLCRL